MVILIRLYNNGLSDSAQAFSVDASRYYSLGDSQIAMAHRMFNTLNLDSLVILGTQV
jgi:hypothetical protein